MKARHSALKDQIKFFYVYKREEKEEHNIVINYTSKVLDLWFHSCLVTLSVTSNQPMSTAMHNFICSDLHATNDKEDVANAWPTAESHSNQYHSKAEIILFTFPHLSSYDNLTKINIPSKASESKWKLSLYFFVYRIAGEKINPIPRFLKHFPNLAIWVFMCYVQF